MIGHILVIADDSPRGEAALQTATALAHATDARVTVAVPEGVDELVRTTGADLVVVADATPRAFVPEHEPAPEFDPARSLLWQLFAANGLVLATATLALLITPLEISRETLVAEAIVLTLGLLVTLGANFALLRHALRQSM